MTSPIPNVVNMETAARLIREAKEAREKRKAENGAKAQAALLAKIEAGLAAAEVAKFPGGIDDLEVGE